MLQHAIQTANNTAVYHLIQAGYDAQYLTATLIKNVREERVTEPNTIARQLVLAKAKGHGGHFHVTNGAHMTCDDLFIAVEMSARRDERAEDEKKKKLALRCQEVEDKALAILQQERSVESLNVLLVRLMDFDETKRTSHHPWCGDDAYALGRGVIKPQAMVGAKAALGHGDTGVPQ